MTVKIIPTEIGIKKAVEVKESNKNIRATWELQKMMTKLSIDQSTAGGEEDIEAFEAVLDVMMETQDKVIGYITNMLRLNDAAVAKLEDLEFDETMTFAIRISSELLHIKMEEATEEETGLEA